jgi:dihydrofolate reductase
LNERPRIVVIAAMARDRTIGKGGKMPWHYSEDSRFFKAITMGTALVMGRKTFASLGRALPGRANIVVTRRPESLARAQPDVLAARSLDEAIGLAAGRGDRTVSVIGGAEIYAAALPLADELILTHVPEDGGGDVFFPKFDEAAWVETSRERRERVEIVRYVRRT